MGGEIGKAGGTGGVSAKGDRPDLEQVPPSGDLVVGGDGASGDVLVRDNQNRVRIRLDAGGTEPPSSTATLGTRVTVDGGRASIRLGGSDEDGTLTLVRDSGEASIELQGNGGSGWFGGRNVDGDLLVFAADAQEPTSDNAAVWLQGKDSSLAFRDGQGNTRLTLQGRGGSGLFGGRGADGDLQLFHSENQQPTDDNASVLLRAADGSLALRDHHGNTRIALQGHLGSGSFGGRGVDGEIVIFNKHTYAPTRDNASIWLQGETGDIVLRNADCAEEFDVRVQDGVGPGSVLVLDDDGQLALCREAYDTRVAGVVSGAAGIRPGIVLGRIPGAEDRLPVGLAGKVVCNVDASFGPIRVGSLLTTSPRPGYAMVVSDRERAFGAVIGKAMAPLETGIGAIPILVGLQ